jgi:glycine/D-amino acid oxidase-like deaminating enzyme
MGSRKRVVICGGGAIGAAIAYFIGRRGAQPIVIERHEVAGAASGKSTAVVEPSAFTKGLMRAAEAHGAVLRHDTVVDLVRHPNGAVRGVALAGGETIEGEAVVIAMGPWSIMATRWLPLPAVLGYKGHSLVFETGGAVPAEALFLEYREASGEILTPELFRGPMVPRGCVRSRPWGRCRSILPMLPLMRARTRGSKRCVGTSRRCLPRRRSKRGRRASGRSPKTAFPSSAPCRALTVASLRPDTVSGACSTRPRPARR